MFSGCSSLNSLKLSNLNTSSVIDMSHMFENCISLTSINLSNFDTHATKNIDFMFSNDINLSYVNFANMQDNQMDKMLNIFSGTLENMVFCINKDLAPNLNRQIERKGCSIIDCDNDWWKNRKTILEYNNKCIEKCNNEFHFWFDYKCHFRCPKDTYPDNNICKKIENDTKDNVACNIRNFFMFGCNYDLNNDTKKQRFIEQTVSELMNLELYDLAIMAIDNYKIFTQTVDNITFQIFALSNKKREENITYINLEECGNVLKQKHRIFNDDLIVFKIEYNSPDYQIPIIEYNIFGRGGKMKLNLNYCKSLRIKYLIPKDISNYEEYLYDPENKYYHDKCFSPKSEEKNDMILYDRKDSFNINNRSLCESMCIFKGYKNNVIECECEIKLKFNSFLNVNSDKYNLIHRFSLDKLTKSFNIWVLKCILNIFHIEILTSNLISFIILGCISITMIGGIIFNLKEKYILIGKIQKIVEGVSLKSKVEGKIIKFKGDNEDDENDAESRFALKNKIIGTKKQNIKNFKKAEKYSLKNEQSSKRIMKDKSNILKLNNENIQRKINHKNTNSNIIRSKIEILDRTDNELNFAKYKDAIIYDKRTCMKYYLSLIRTKHLLIFPFSTKNDYNAYTMKICFVFLILGIILAINVLFIDEADIHELYISKGEFNIFYHLQKILFSTIASLIIKYILLWTIFTEKNFLQLKNQIINGKLDRYNKEMAILTIKSAYFFPLSIIILILFWIYIICFGSVFRNSHIHILKLTIISFIIHLILPFIYNIIPCIFRTCSLGGTKNREYLYRFSQILQYI
jgi:surface protein